MRRLRVRARQILAERHLVKDSGATAVEYALLVALIAAIIVGVVTTIGPKIIPGFQAVIDGLP